VAYFGHVWSGYEVKLRWQVTFVQLIMPRMAGWILNRQRSQAPGERLIPNPKLRFMEQCREVMRFKRLALRSEQAYLEWIKRFILFHGKRHPKDMGVTDWGSQTAGWLKDSTPHLHSSPRSRRRGKLK
jgi:hypothetical protein